jgi:pyruvate-formate lyase-activating enzyme
MSRTTVVEHDVRIHRDNTIVVTIVQKESRSVGICANPPPEADQVWLEITTLLIPGENDSEPEIEEMTQWIVDRLGPDVPLHFTAFHPDWKMIDKPIRLTQISKTGSCRRSSMETGT